MASLTVTIPALATARYIIISPIVIPVSDISVDFTGVPRNGTSPLIVDFTANVTFGGSASGKYSVSKYNWYFDTKNNPSVYEVTTTSTVTHVYTGYYGQTFSSMLQVEIEPILNSSVVADFNYEFIEG
jgi:hypothetical protein